MDRHLILAYSKIGLNLGESIDVNMILCIKLLNALISLQTQLLFRALKLTMFNHWLGFCDTVQPFSVFSIYKMLGIKNRYQESSRRVEPD